MSMREALKRFVCGSVFVAAAATSTPAQWLNYPTQSVPRLPNGKVDLTAQGPRTADGHPNLSGVWHAYSEPLEEKQRLFGADVAGFRVIGDQVTDMSKYATDLLIDFKPGEIAMTAEGQLASNRLRQAGSLTTRCLPMGIPRGTLMTMVFKIVQTPDLTLVMHEQDSMTRQIYTDGRPLPAAPTPSWLGYSVGRWEGDALVVETIGFNDRTPLDGRAHPRSEAMKIVERYRRVDVGHLDVEMTFDDPKTYTKPFTVKVTHLLQPDSDILEYVCNENEKDREHMTR